MPTLPSPPLGPLVQCSLLASLILLEKMNGFCGKTNGKVWQNPDDSNLRLASREVKQIMDHPKCGGPDFKAIVIFLHLQMGSTMKRDFATLLLQWFNEEEGCDTCDGCIAEQCKCKEKQRFGESIRKLDPRLIPEFKRLPLRWRAKLLLRIHVWVASNFHREYYQKWEECCADLDEDEILGFDEPDLTVIETGMYYGNDVFLSSWGNTIPSYLISSTTSCDLTVESFFKTIGTTMTGMGDIGKCSVKRWKFFASPQMQWTWIHRYTFSQIQYIPETIRRYVENCVDCKAIALLGGPIANARSIT